MQLRRGFTLGNRQGPRLLSHPHQRDSKPQLSPESTTAKDYRGSLLARTSTSVLSHNEASDKQLSRKRQPLQQALSE